MSDIEVVIVEAVRTPVGKRRGGLATVHSADLLGTALTSLVDRAGIDAALVDQVIGGCVSQVGMQSFNVTRTAWLAAGLPTSTAASTVDTQCGSSQQATNLVYGLLKSGVIDVGVVCGVESMSQVPLGSNSDKRLGFGRALSQVLFCPARVDQPVRWQRSGSPASGQSVVRTPTSSASVPNSWPPGHGARIGSGPSSSRRRPRGR